MGLSTHRSSPYQFDHISTMSQTAKLRGGLSNCDGPVNSATNLSSLTTSDSFHSGSFAMGLDEGQRELLSGNMSLSVLHIHETHHRQRHGRSSHLPAEASAAHPDLQLSSSFQFSKPQRAAHTNFGYSANTSGLSNQVSSPLQPGENRQDGFLFSRTAPQSVASVNCDMIDNLTFEASFSHPQDTYNDDTYPTSEFSSLPPLSLPQLPYGRPSSLMTRPASGQTHSSSMASRIPSDHMPEIKEDIVEHEIDTSISPK